MKSNAGRVSVSKFMSLVRPRQPQMIGIEPDAIASHPLVRD